MVSLPEGGLPSSPEDTDGQEEAFVIDVVMIAVNRHRASNAAAVLDPVTKTVIG